MDCIIFVVVIVKQPILPLPVLAIRMRLGVEEIEPRVHSRMVKKGERVQGIVCGCI